MEKVNRLTECIYKALKLNYIRCENRKKLNLKQYVDKTNTVKPLFRVHLRD